MACYLQNPKAMVRVIIIIIYTHLFFVGVGQVTHNEIGLNASFSCDKVFMGDSLELFLNFRNLTKDNFCLYPKATLALGHDHEVFITYDRPGRVAYILNQFTDYDSILCIKPGEVAKYTFNIVADSNFFYKGENEVIVYYHLFDKPLMQKRRRTDKGKPILSLWSPPVKIYVSPKDRSLNKHPATGH